MDNNKRTLSWSQIILYGAGGMFPYGFQLVLTGYYVNFFMTNVIMVPTAMAATLNVIIQWVKVLTMVAAGVIIDAIPFKSGKYRTWWLICAFVVAIFLPLTFAYFGISPAAAGILFVIFYTVQMLGYNVGWTALRTLAGVLGKTGNDSVILGSAANVAGTIPSVIYPFIYGPIFAIPLWAGTQNIYMGFGVISGIIIIIGGFIIYGLCKDVDGPAQAAAYAGTKKEKVKRVGFFEMIKNLKGPGLIFFIITVFNAAQSGVFSTLLTYYAIYVLKNPGITASTISATAAAAMIGSVFVPAIAKKFGKKNLYIFQFIAMIVLYAVLVMAGNNGTLFVIIRAAQTLVGCVSNCLLPAFMVDIADYNEMKGEVGARAFLQSMGGTATRLGFSLGSIISSFTLAIVGFDATLAEQTAKTLSGIKSFTIIAPAAACLIALIFTFLYKVDENALNDYRMSKVNE